MMMMKEDLRDGIGWRELKKGLEEKDGIVRV